MLDPVRNIKRAHTIRGTSLLEMLLTVGIISVFFVFLIEVGRTIAREQVAAAAANYVIALDKTIQETLANPANFSSFYAATLVQPGNIVQTSVANLRARTGFVATLPLAPLLNENFPDVAPYNQTYRVIFRVGDNPLITTDTPALDVYILSETLINDVLVTRIASKIGSNGGALRNTNNAATGTIRAAYGLWTVPMTELVATAWYGAVTGNPAPTLINGGYVVAYQRYDLKRVARDYLYRNPQADPTLNAMNADLSLGNYNMLGVDDIGGTAAQVTANQMIVGGNARIVGTTNISGQVQSDGPVTFTGPVTSSSGAVDVVVEQGSILASSATVTGAQAETSVNISNALTTNQMVAQTTNVTGSLNVTAPAGIQASVAPAGLAISGTATVGGVLRGADIVSGGDITVNAGEIGTIDMQTSNLTQSNGTVTGIQTLSVGGTARVGAFGACNNGC